ncbi:serine/threonine-protein kinase [Cellulomonas cellasea]|uniref:Putative Ser/Thr protein kinase n=1 Tax=Cellulomonas cellasea TaxID=43670 RepID=A0A7W4UJK5_9CELL|nr:serine/threonine-protein kinase [Cellulomonas cellasea]MBB2925365.1 putative Ser/Thr protein kinase [Cellulomonas cellasea]
MERKGLTPGSEVGGYSIVAPLGSGGMGTVYRALDGGGAAVALKLLHGADDTDTEARERLRREVLALQRLRHPAVAAVLDAEADSTEAFIVTELVDGVNLEEHVREHGPLDAAALHEVAEGLRSALTAVHEAGVVHRDLKPSNVLVTEHGPVLIDFGIAHAADDARVTSTGLVIGTPGYLAPELLDGAEPTARSDWWGWAALLAFAATGRAPFGLRPLEQVLAQARSGDPDVAGIGPLTAGALRGALAADPDARLTPADVVAALQVAVADGDPVSPGGAGAGAGAVVGSAGAGTGDGVDDDADGDGVGDDAGVDDDADHDGADDEGADEGADDDGADSDDDAEDAVATVLLTKRAPVAVGAAGAAGAGTAVAAAGLAGAAGAAAGAHDDDEPDDDEPDDDEGAGPDDDEDDKAWADDAQDTVLLGATGTAVGAVASSTVLTNDGHTQVLRAPVAAPPSVPVAPRADRRDVVAGGVAADPRTADDVAYDDVAYDDGGGDADDDAWADPSGDDAELEDDAAYERPFARRRWGSLLALGLLATAAAALYPGWTLVVLGVLLVLVRTAGSTVEAMYARRERNGVRRTDTLRAVVSTPWHLVLAVLGLLPAVLVAGCLVLIVLGVVWWLLTGGYWAPDGVRGGEPTGIIASAIVAGVFVLGLVTLWWGPIAHTTRIGARRVLSVVAPGRAGAFVLTLVALAVAAVLVLETLGDPQVVWSPLPQPRLP